MTAVPAGKAWTPSTTIGLRSVARTGSSTLLLVGRHAGLQLERQNGPRGDRDLTVFAAIAWVAACWRTCLRLAVRPQSQRQAWQPISDAVCARDLLYAGDLGSRARRSSHRQRAAERPVSAFTSTSRPATSTPSFLWTVTSLPVGISMASRFEQALSATAQSDRQTEFLHYDSLSGRALQ